VIGIELASMSDTYEWIPEGGDNFEKRTLFSGRSISEVPLWRRASATIRACLRSRARHVFLCHYEQWATLVVAWTLRLAGRRVYVMNDSKFDDYPRFLWRELAKSIFYLPYQGALSGSARSSDYLRFLGIRPDHIEPAYDARSVTRIRQLAGVVPAPGGVPFAARHFSIVARFIPEKNLTIAIEAYRLFCATSDDCRDLHLYGSGALERDLRAMVEKAGLADKVHFKGFLQADQICAALGSTLALVFPSKKDTFGAVVIEALAMGVPVIVSDSCGARDSLVRTGVNGFVVEPDNAEGLAFFMRMLASDESLWRRMSIAAEKFVWNCDVAQFAASVERLIEN
jgi:glycosyltransferase involved in cell wall biosynthesis